MTIVDNARVTQRFDTPVSYMSDRDHHEAVDYITAHHEAVHAPFSAEVTHIVDKYGESQVTGYGNRVFIKYVQHGTVYQASFSHLLKGVNVEVGQQVKQGDVLGRTGRTGFRVPLRTIHTHYELKINGKRVDPEDENNYPKIINEGIRMIKQVENSDAVWVKDESGTNLWIRTANNKRRKVKASSEPMVAQLYGQYGKLKRADWVEIAGLEEGEKFDYFNQFNKRPENFEAI